MKYKLKKDLPFAKAGEELITDSICVYTMGDVFNAGAKRQTKLYLGDILELTESGWIEEVKPREWYVGLTSQGFTCGIADNRDYFEHLERLPNKLIVVREVIE